MMRRLVVGNWKMNKTAAQTAAFIDAFLCEVPLLPQSIDIAIAPPFTALARAGEMLRGTRVGLTAQNMHWESSGAFTGEIAADMLVELGVSSVILGHSERRQLFGETDEAVNKKVRAALAHDLTPIVCVGETLAERDADQAQQRVAAQTRAALDGVSTDELAKIVLAYEPVWAIGTGRNCEVAQADATMAAIRQSVAGLDEVRILYGGSMKVDNVASYAHARNVGGGLVGGASLDPVAFAALIRAANPQGAAG
jgi:triosephosphate isomerase